MACQPYSSDYLFHRAIRYICVLKSFTFTPQVTWFFDSKLMAHNRFNEMTNRNAKNSKHTSIFCFFSPYFHFTSINLTAPKRNHILCPHVLSSVYVQNKFVCFILFQNFSFFFIIFWFFVLSRSTFSFSTHAIYNTIL